MEVTDVKVFPVSEERLKAYATITFDDCFVVRDLKIIHGNSGLFVAMPSKKRKDGTFKDTAHPLNNETREMIESRVLDCYEKEMAKQGVNAGELPARRPFPADHPDDRRQNVPTPEERRSALEEDGDELPSDFQSKV